MKKLAFLIFVAAIIIGISLAYATGSVGKAGSWMSLKFGSSGVKGSGNVKAETRELPKFSAIDSGGAIEMEVIAQKDQQIQIEADDNILPLITTEVKDDTLYISNQQKIGWCSQIKVRISVQDLNALNVSGASKANVVNIKAENFKIDVSGASKVKLEGETAALEAEASGASRVEADNFKAGRVNASASGASKVMVFASESVEANASGASKVTYTGNPKTVNKKASGASSVSSN